MIPGPMAICRSSPCRTRGGSRAIGSTRIGSQRTSRPCCSASTVMDLFVISPESMSLFDGLDSVRRPDIRIISGWARPREGPPASHPTAWRGTSAVRPNRRRCWIVFLAPASVFVDACSLIGPVGPTRPVAGSSLRFGPSGPRPIHRPGPAGTTDGSDGPTRSNRGPEPAGRAAGPGGRWVRKDRGGNLLGEPHHFGASAACATGVESERSARAPSPENEFKDSE